MFGSNTWSGKSTSTPTLATPKRAPKAATWRNIRWSWVSYVVGIVAVVVVGLMLWWSREPAVFDVQANARAMTNTPTNMPLKPGMVTTATLARIAQTLLDKNGGYISNDLSPPGLIMDNIPNWEFGLLTQVRDASLAMRDDLSRVRSQSVADPDLVKAQIRFNTDSKLWLLPPAESQYREGVAALSTYLKRLNTGEAQFYARADNLNNWLMKVQRQLGTLSLSLSASIGVKQADANYHPHATDTLTANSANNPELALMDNGAVDLITDSQNADGVLIKTPRLKVDDIFYQARGQTWALLHLLKAIEYDFADILRDKNALVSWRQIINKLEQTQEMVWSPIILNGRGYGVVTNHSLIMVSQISRANAALIDLSKLLLDG